MYLCQRRFGFHLKKRCLLNSNIRMRFRLGSVRLSTLLHDLGRVADKVLPCYQAPHAFDEVVQPVPTHKEAQVGQAKCLGREASRRAPLSCARMSSHVRSFFARESISIRTETLNEDLPQAANCIACSMMYAAPSPHQPNLHRLGDPALYGPRSIAFYRRFPCKRLCFIHFVPVWNWGSQPVRTQFPKLMSRQSSSLCPNNNSIYIQVTDW